MRVSSRSGRGDPAVLHARTKLTGVQATGRGGSSIPACPHESPRACDGHDVEAALKAPFDLLFASAKRPRGTTPLPRGENVSTRDMAQLRRRCPSLTGRGGSRPSGEEEEPGVSENERTKTGPREMQGLATGRSRSLAAAAGTQHSFRGFGRLVYGDIGTSPLYAVQTVFSIDGGRMGPTTGDVLGVISMVPGRSPSSCRSSTSPSSSGQTTTARAACWPLLTLVRPAHQENTP